MELVLVHITDIHLENDTDYNILEGRSEYIANAINKHIIDETNTLLILCITGDIAYSGKEEQYLFVAVEAGFDLVCNMWDNLNRSSAEISAAFFLKNGPIDLSCCNIGILCQAFIDKSFVMTKVKVSFRTVIGNKNFTSREANALARIVFMVVDFLPELF